MMLAALLLSADPFLIERIDTPEGVVAEVGGIDVDSQGRVWACFHHGEVCVLEDNAWRTFATGGKGAPRVVFQNTHFTVVETGPHPSLRIDVNAAHLGHHPFGGIDAFNQKGIGR